MDEERRPADRVRVDRVRPAAGRGEGAPGGEAHGTSAALEDPRRLGRPSSAKALFAPIAAAVLFAGSYIAAKIAARELSPLSTTLLRYIPAIAFLAVLALVRDRAALRVPRGDLGRFLLLGLTGIVGYHYFFFAALRHTTAVNTAVINASSPIVTAVLSALVLSERLPIASYAGIVVSMSGVLVLLSRGDLAGLVEAGVNRGDLSMLLSVASWAVYSVVIKRLSSRYSSLALSLWAMIAGVAALAPIVVSEGFVREVRAMSPESGWAVLYMGLAASGAGYLAYNAGIGAIGPTRASSVVYSLVPVFVAALSWVFLDEPVTLLLALSVALIVVGLNLALRRRRDR